jgi:hypothetical protein
MAVLQFALADTSSRLSMRSRLSELYGAVTTEGRPSESDQLHSLDILLSRITRCNRKLEDPVLKV